MSNRLYVEELNKELFQDYKKADKFMLKLIFMHWILVSTASAYFYSTYLFGFISGGMLFFTALISYKYYSGTALFRVLVSLIIMTFTIISIQQNLGRIEFHFHVFIVLSFLTVYKDLLPATVASIYIILHHLLFTYLQLNNATLFDMQIMVFNYGCGYDIAVLHAVFVIFEWIVLYRIVTANIDSFEYASLYKNELKHSNVKLEKEKQIAVNATKAKSDFLANMSHEIRTPLNAMMGFIDIIKSSEKSNENKEYLNIVKDSGNSLMSIINDILDFSKIESGNMTLERVQFDLKRTVKDIGLLFYEKAKEKNIDIKIHFDNNLPNIINGDPVRFRQVASNLISNAIKFTLAHGTVKMNVLYDKDNSVLTLEIEDNGVGIASENIDKILKPFEQEDSSTTRKYGGTGLGLSICSNLIKLMGGELKVKSKLGEGSTFYFSIPIEESEIQEVTDDNINKIKSEGFDFSSKKVLLVEDNKANQIFMKVLLKKMDIEVEIANDGLESIEMFKLSKYDAVLMDENMPNMSGMEATKHILDYEKDNGLIHTPIIALTANALKGDREVFLSSGMDEYVTKPVDKDILSNTLGKVFLKE